MCCLKYEQESYEYLLKKTPNIGATVKTADGVGVVTDVNVITGNLIVKINDSEAAPVKVHRDKVTIISRGKQKKVTEETDKQ